MAFLTGDDPKRAFHQLYNDYFDALYSRVLKMVGDSSAAEDILQNAFIKIWINFNQYDQSKSTLFTWMLRICRNEVIDSYRASKNSKRKIPRHYIESIYSTPVENINNIDFHKLIEPLDNSDKALVSLIYFYGFTYQEASQIMRLPLGTVKTKVRTILQRWRPAMKRPA